MTARVPPPERPGSRRARLHRRWRAASSHAVSTFLVGAAGGAAVLFIVVMIAMACHALFTRE